MNDRLAGKIESVRREREKKKFAKWNEEFQIQKRRDKIAKIRSTLIASCILVFIALVLYSWSTGELKFVGQKTEFTTARVIKTQMHHIGKGFYLQRVTYEFDYNEKKYTDTFEAGQSIGEREVGDRIKIKFSTSNPNRSLMIGVYKATKNQ